MRRKRKAKKKKTGVTGVLEVYMWGLQVNPD